MRRSAHVLCAATVVVAHVSYTRVAAASSTRSWSAVQCKPSVAGPYFSISGYAFVTDTGYDWAPLYCPVVSDDAFDASSATTIVISGISNTDGVAAQACRSYYDGTGGTCGDFSFAAATTSVFHLNLDTSGWSGGGAGDSYYVLALMFGPTSSAYQSLWEYHVVVP